MTTNRETDNERIGYPTHSPLTHFGIFFQSLITIYINLIFGFGYRQYKFNRLLCGISVLGGLSQEVNVQSSSEELINNKIIVTEYVEGKVKGKVERKGKWINGVLMKRC